MMHIIRIESDTPNNIKGKCSELMVQQMKAIGEKPNKNKIESAIENLLKPESRTHLLLILDQYENAFGTALFNVCCGIQSGGDYIWINEIYIKEEERAKGYGHKILNHIIIWAKENNCKYIAANTWKSNNISKKLFTTNGFEIENTVWMDKQM